MFSKTNKINGIFNHYGLFSMLVPVIDPNWDLEKQINSRDGMYLGNYRKGGHYLGEKSCVFANEDWGNIDFNISSKSEKAEITLIVGIVKNRADATRLFKKYVKNNPDADYPKSFASILVYDLSRQELMIYDACGFRSKFYCGDYRQLYTPAKWHQVECLSEYELVK